MALQEAQRARIILDLLLDGNVTTEANYGNGIDKAAPAVAQKYADAILDAYPRVWYDNATPPAVRQPTNDEKALHMIKILKGFLKEHRVNHARKIDAATKAAQDAALAAVNAEVASELGD